MYLDSLSEVLRICHKRRSNKAADEAICSRISGNVGDMVRWPVPNISLPLGADEVSVGNFDICLCGSRQAAESL